MARRSLGLLVARRAVARLVVARRAVARLVVARRAVARLVVARLARAPRALPPVLAAAAGPLACRAQPLAQGRRSAAALRRLVAAALLGRSASADAAAAA
jgi:hypothetical protein